MLKTLLTRRLVSTSSKSWRTFFLDEHVDKLTDSDTATIPGTFNRSRAGHIVGASDHMTIDSQL